MVLLGQNDLRAKEEAVAAPVMSLTVWAMQIAFWLP